MDINFVALVLGLGAMIISFITKKKIYNIIAIPTFLFLTINNSSEPLLAFAFVSATIIAVTDMFWVRGE